MDGQTYVGHINLIGGLVTRNPPKNENIFLTFTKKNIFATSGPLGALHGSCTTYVVGGPLIDHLQQIYKQVIYKLIKWRKD